MQENEKREIAKQLVLGLLAENSAYLKEYLKESLEADLESKFNAVRNAFEAHVSGNLDASLLLDEVVDEVLDELLTIEVVAPESLPGLPDESPATEPPVDSGAIVPPPPDVAGEASAPEAPSFTYENGRYASQEEYLEQMHVRAEVLGFGSGDILPTNRPLLSQLFVELAKFYDTHMDDAHMALDALMNAYRTNPGDQLSLDAMESFATDEVRAMGLSAHLDELLEECEEPSFLAMLLVLTGKLKLHHMGDMEGAREAFEKALMMDPTYDAAKALLDAVTV